MSTILTIRKEQLRVAFKQRLLEVLSLELVSTFSNKKSFLQALPRKNHHDTPRLILLAMHGTDIQSHGRSRLQQTRPPQLHILCLHLVAPRNLPTSRLQWNRNADLRPLHQRYLRRNHLLPSPRLPRRNLEKGNQRLHYRYPTMGNRVGYLYYVFCWIRMLFYQRSGIFQDCLGSATRPGCFPHAWNSIFAGVAAVASKGWT